MDRVPTTELLDSDAGTPAEVDASLRDLQRINRWFGGAATTREMVRAVALRTGTKQLTMLEVAAGSGDVSGTVRRTLAAVGIDLQVTLLDRAVSHLTSASSERRVVADALTLPFREGSFDLVACGLFAHHLSPEELIRFVNEGLRVCRRAVLINDLIRHRLHLAAVYAGFPLYNSRLTRHDAPASVRQAYTPEEISELLGRSKAARVEVGRHYLFRMGVIAWKQ